MTGVWDGAGRPLLVTSTSLKGAGPYSYSRSMTSPVLVSHEISLGLEMPGSRSMGDLYEGSPHPLTNWTQRPLHLSSLSSQMGEAPTSLLQCMGCLRALCTLAHVCCPLWEQCFPGPAKIPIAVRPVSPQETLSPASSSLPGCRPAIPALGWCRGRAWGAGRFQSQNPSVYLWGPLSERACGGSLDACLGDREHGHGLNIL